MRLEGGSVKLVFSLKAVDALGQEPWAPRSIARRAAFAASSASRAMLGSPQPHEALARKLPDEAADLEDE